MDSLEIDKGVSLFYTESLKANRLAGLVFVLELVFIATEGAFFGARGSIHYKERIQFYLIHSFFASFLCIIFVMVRGMVIFP